MKDWIEATDHQLTRAVGEALGWTRCRRSTALGFEEIVGRPPVWKGEEESLPDYPNDLNACAEMEESLSPPQLDQYALSLLHNVCIGPNSPRPFRATARQRCIAFLNTVG